VAFGVGIGVRVATIGAVCAACLGTAAGASAHHSEATPDGDVPAGVQQALGGEVTELADGLFEVDPRRGPDLTTHGPDTAVEIRPDHGTTLAPGDPERPLMCASDNYQRVLYARPASAPDRFATVKPQIQATMRRINASSTAAPPADDPGPGGSTPSPGPGGASNAADATPPDTTITNKPKKGTLKRRAKFEFSSSETGSSFECKLDGTGFSACAPPHVIRLERGRHSFEVRAIDAAGNVDEAPAAYVWKIRRR